MSKTILLAGQKKWVADKSPLKVIEKGRRTGITWAEASDDVIIAASSRKAGGMNVYYFPQAKEDAIEYIETCGKWARAFDYVCGEVQEGTWEDELGMVLKADDPDKVIKTYKIEFASGFRIVALSSSPQRARGKQGVFVIDEAAFHPNFRGVIKAVMASFLRGGKIRVISTHNGEDNPFNELINEIRSGARKGSVHSYPFRSAIADGMYKRICEVNGEEWTLEKEQQYIEDAYGLYGDDAAEELDAIPSHGEGTYLSRAIIEGVMNSQIPVIRLAMPDEFTYQPKHIREAEINDWCEEHLKPLLKKLHPHLKHYFGSDFARSGDLSVIWPLEEKRTLDLHTPFVVELRNIPFEQQRQILFYIVDRLPRFMAGAMDARGNGQYMAEVAAQKYGSMRIGQIMLSQEWYRDHMPRFKAHFEDRTRDVPKDADILADMRAVKKDKGVAKVPDDAHTTGSDGKPRHGDAAIACALADYAVAEMEGMEIDYMAVPKTSRRESTDRMHQDPMEDVYQRYEHGAW